MSGAFVVVGADFWGYPPGKLPSPELVHHFLVLPPGTHGFAGGGLPLPSLAGPAGQAYIQLIKANNYKKAKTPTSIGFV